jgi:hypothetical protein
MTDAEQQEAGKLAEQVLALGQFFAPLSPGPATLLARAVRHLLQGQAK